MSATKSRSRDLRHARRSRRHGCWDHLIVAPLWVADRANLGTLLRSCDAAGACMAVPGTPHYHGALAVGDTLMSGRGASLNAAVAGSLVLYRLAWLS